MISLVEPRRFSPGTGFDPEEGADPRVVLSRDNPLKERSRDGEAGVARGVGGRVGVHTGGDNL